MIFFANLIKNNHKVCYQNHKFNIKLLLSISYFILIFIKTLELYIFVVYFCVCIVKKLFKNIFILVRVYEIFIII